MLASSGFRPSVATATRTSRLAACLTRAGATGQATSQSFTQWSNTMAITKDQLISDIAEATDTTKAAVRAVLDQLSEIVSDSLENSDEITLPGIGKLKVGDRPARTGRNPQTGKTIQIAAKKVVKFVPAKGLSDAVNK
ncbi:HU family DNA-binding protein [Pseudomonas sp. LFM046]|uniref:HU family DNA-binding protein n=1 Tax=Pseudomonas sp. LFM046 TaxID=1608357 RepID=UPI002413154B|nr:HU family DNA-binding protein [Pseudomonas sp. LFM046]